MSTRLMLRSQPLRSSGRVRSPCLMRWPHGDVIGLAIGVDDFQVEHFHVGAAHVQANRFGVTFLSPNRNGVAIPAEQGDLLTTEFHPGPGAGWRWRRRRRAQLPLHILN